jgi:hypothetical protein
LDQYKQARRLPQENPPCPGGLIPRLQRVQGKRPGRLRFAVVDFIPLLDAFQRTFDEFAHGDYRHHLLPAACREALTRPIATI